jgi:transmembrane protein 17
MINAPDLVLQRKPSLSSLGLQMVLYYNACFSVIFIVVMGSCAFQKAVQYHRYVPSVAVGLFTLVEPVRLWFGFSGNLREKVPDLATYLLMTSFPQFPLVIYLAYLQRVKYPIDSILGSMMLLLTILQSYYGLSSMKRLIRSQTAQFMRLCDEE